MRFRNDGKGEANILQNQFTAYLMTAIRRRKVTLLQERAKLAQRELSVDLQGYLPGALGAMETPRRTYRDVPIENAALERALEQIEERDRYIFFARVLDERGFSELAAELGMGYKGVAAAYYRVIRKIKSEMRGDGK